MGEEIQSVRFSSGDQVQQIRQRGLVRLYGPHFVDEVLGGEFTLKPAPDAPPLRGSNQIPRLFPKEDFRKI